MPIPVSPIRSQALPKNSKAVLGAFFHIALARSRMCLCIFPFGPGRFRQDAIYHLPSYLRGKIKCREKTYFGVWRPWLVMVLSLQATKAATISWTGTTGDWSDPTNWGGTLPTSSDDAYITNDGTADVSQGQSDICNNLYLGNSGTGQSGTILMNGGSITWTHAEYVGYSGIGTFTQSGGATNSHSGIYDLEALYLGYNPGSSGTYNLSGTGILSAKYEYIGLYGSSGLFHQSGGTNTVKSGLYIRQTGQYKLSGGTMQITGGLANAGIFDFDNGPGVLNVAANSLVNLAMPGSSLLNTGSATLNVGAGSLLIVPADFDTTTTFAHYNNEGRLHIAGTPLNIDVGQTITGWGAIADHVYCQGTINASQIDLLNGLTISGTGSVNTINLAVDDTYSGMNGGNLNLYYQIVGYKGTGIFDHSGGNNSTKNETATLNLWLGNNPGTNGTYNLSGTGILRGISEIVGYSGIGTFNQNSGTNTIYSYTSSSNKGLILGLNAGSKGTYNLSDTGYLNLTYGNTWGNETIGSSGVGIFNEYSGINSLGGGTLYLGLNTGSSGTYNQSGGTNTAYTIILGNASGSNGRWWQTSNATFHQLFFPRKSSACNAGTTSKFFRSITLRRFMSEVPVNKGF